MVRLVIVFLVTVELVLLTAFALAPANATSTDVENYSWGFAYVGSNQVVCKKLAMHPQEQIQSQLDRRKVVKVSYDSTVVSDSYCANLAKPSGEGR
ncbi:MAG TPA: hypothetical protein DCE56_06030 [Cyanobacteria bacterium UBA8553]|nr:hypothetical protein [Cyanobacteria bacterium UBA8553]HAJ61702.1 hypothetical protein [Cyanobacteria bacterium UBA8543]